MYPTECGEQLGTDPSKIGSSKSLVLKSFSGKGTLWDSSLPVSLTLWDTPALCTPPLPLPPKKAHANFFWKFPSDFCTSLVLIFIINHQICGRFGCTSALSSLFWTSPGRHGPDASEARTPIVILVVLGSQS